MELIKKLPTLKSKSGHYMSMGLFECPKCGRQVEKPLSNGKKSKTCGCVQLYKTKDQALSCGGLIHLEDLKNGFAKFQCPYCDCIFGELKKKAKTQKSCGCLKTKKWKETKFFLPFPPQVRDGHTICPNCGGSPSKAFANLLSGRWGELHCPECIPNKRTGAEYCEEAEKEYIDHINSDEFLESLLGALPADEWYKVPIILDAYRSQAIENRYRWRQLLDK